MAGFHIRFKDSFPFVSVSPLNAAFNRVSLNIPLGDGWRATAATYKSAGVITTVEFKKPGAEKRIARMQSSGGMGDYGFMDRLPNDTGVHTDETRKANTEFFGRVERALLAHRNKGIKISCDF